MAAIVVAAALAGLAVWGHVPSSGPAAAKGSAVGAAPMAEPREAMSLSAPVDWPSQELQPVKRNLFAVHLEDFPSAKDLRGNPEFLGMVAKSSAEPADLTMEGQIVPENLRRAADALRLQGTVMGTAPTAVVNGREVKEGDVVGGFGVVKIETGGIVVERDGVRLRIEGN